MSSTHALVTLVVGIEFERRFERHSRPNWKAYAERYGYDLIILDRPLDQSGRARSRPFYWQKNLVLEQEEVAKYRQIAWVDSDIVINAASAPPIFEGVPEDRVGAVDEYSVPDPPTYRKALALTYLRWRREGRPFLHNLTPEQFYRNRGFPVFDQVVQGGLLVCSPRYHRGILREVYDRHEHMNIPGSNYEMAALSFELLRRNLVTWLDAKFNRLVMFGLAEHLQPLVKSEAGLERPDSVAMCRVLAHLLANSFFLHFAGCHELLDRLE
jgi:hypothetical protein